MYGNLLVVGCTSCSSGVGWYKFYDSRTFEELYEYRGVSGTRIQVGNRVNFERDDVNFLRIYFSTLNSTKKVVYLNALIVKVKEDESYSFADGDKYFMTGKADGLP